VRDDRGSLDRAERAGRILGRTVVGTFFVSSAGAVAAWIVGAGPWASRCAWVAGGCIVFTSLMVVVAVVTSRWAK